MLLSKICVYVNYMASCCLHVQIRVEGTFAHSVIFIEN